jgi:hypothetical protein
MEREVMISGNIVMARLKGAKNTSEGESEL